MSLRRVRPSLAVPAVCALLALVSGAAPAPASGRAAAPPAARLAASPNPPRRETTVSGAIPPGATVPARATSEAAPNAADPAVSGRATGTPDPTMSGTGVTGPGMTGPGTSGPALTGPSVSGPGVTGPGVTGPGVTGPGVTGPGVTGPGGTGSPATDPAGSAADPVWRRAALRVDHLGVDPQPTGAAGALGPLDLQRATPGVTASEPVLVAGAAAVEPFVLIGFSWRGPATTTARYRVHTAAGWGTWRPVVRESGHGPDPAAEPATAAGNAATATADPDPTADTPAGPIDAPDALLVSDPQWVGEADGWQLGIDGDAAALQVHLVRPDLLAVPPATAAATGTGGGGDPSGGQAATGFDAQRTDPLELAPLYGGDAAFDGSSAPTLRPNRQPERPDINLRSAWGARPAASDTWTAQSLHVAVVHHTGSGESATYDADDVPAMLRAIQAYHMDTNGWIDIGYDFVVDRFGRIWEARQGGIDTLTVGAHAEGMNTGSVGVVILGDFSTIEPSAEALDGVERLLAWKLFRHGADPSRSGTLLPRTTDRFPAGQPVTLPRIVGHGDVNTTGCPGNVEDFLPAIRAEVERRYDDLVATTTTLLDGTLPLVGRGRPAIGDIDKDGRDDVFWYRPGSEPDELWLATPDGGFARSTYAVADGGGNGTVMTRLDWDGDGTLDLLFSTPGRSTVTLLEGSPSGAMTSHSLPASGDAIPVVGDFDGDGDDEILFYRPGVTTLPMLESTAAGGATVFNLTITGGPYRPVAGDFTGDLRTDVVWYAPGNGADLVWISRGGHLFTSRSATMGGDYQPVTADLDGDQRADIVWTRPGGGMTPVWFGGDTFTTVSVDYGPSAALLLADVNGGGSADVVTVTAESVATVWLRQAGTEWVVRSGHVAEGAVPLAADFDGDGRRDLWWWVDGRTAALWRAG